MTNGKDYKYHNKPTGLLHFLEASDPPIADDAVIALLDPDMILMKPLFINFTLPETQPLDYSGMWEGAEMPLGVAEGQPIAQHYGIGPKWLEFNRSRICGPGSPCTTKYEREKPSTARTVNSFFGVGPPYIGRKNDLRRIAAEWARMTPLIYDEFPKLLAEMYGYSMAAAHLDLPHFRVNNFMVSAIERMYTKLEGWGQVDRLVADPTLKCDPSILDVPLTRGWGALPPLLHYCQGYRAPGARFNKYTYQTNFFQCDTEPLAVPDTDSWAEPPQPDKRGRVNDEIESPRLVFMACYTLHAVNAALEGFKAANC